MDEKHIVIIDDWLETIPEDEMGKISLPEAWRAAVNATFDALIKEGYLTEDCRPDWAKVAYKLKGCSPRRIVNLSAEHFNSMVSDYPELARTATGLAILSDWAYCNALTKESGVSDVMQDLYKLNEMQKDADIASELRDTIAVQASTAKTHAAKVNAIIAEGIDRILGKDQWTLGGIRGRLSKRLAGGDVWVFQLDGRDFLELHPPVLNDFDCTEEIKTPEVKTNYRYIGLAAQRECNA